MQRISRHRAPQQVHWLARHFHAAAGRVRESNDAVDIRKLRQPFGREVLGDFVHDRRRAVHHGQHADVIARGDLAVCAHYAHEGRTLALRDKLHRAIILGIRVIAVEFAELHVVRMHERARRDIGRRKTYRHVVLEYGLALFDGARRNFVAGRHLAATREAVAKLGADLDIGARDHHVVRLVQADDGTGGGFLQDFYHGIHLSGQ